MKIYKTIFIGNRPLILNQILKNKYFEIAKIFILENSLIDLKEIKDFKNEIFSIKDKNYIIKELLLLDYDLCITAGCPFIIPKILFNENKYFINSHPSYLPLGKGINPLNECFLSDHKITGSTLHYLNESIDGGDIIYQKKINITNDIDVSILYSIIFEFECKVFLIGLNRLIKSNFKYKGTKQIGYGTYYSRKEFDRFLNIENITIEILNKKIRAFSSRNLGVDVKIDDTLYTIYRGHQIKNHSVINLLNNEKKEGIIVRYVKDDFFILKISEKFFAVTSWMESK